MQRCSLWMQTFFFHVYPSLNVYTSWGCSTDVMFGAIHFILSIGDPSISVVFFYDGVKQSTDNHQFSFEKKKHIIRASHGAHSAQTMYQSYQLWTEKWEKHSCIYTYDYESSQMYWSLDYTLYFGFGRSSNFFERLNNMMREKLASIMKVNVMLVKHSHEKAVGNFISITSLDSGRNI